MVAVSLCSRNVLPCFIKLVTLLCKPNRGPGLALGPLEAPEYESRLSILGLGCLCRPFPAGLTNVGGGRQPRSIGLSTWTVHVDKWLELRRLPQILFYLRSGAYGDFQKSEPAPKGYTT